MLLVSFIDHVVTALLRDRVFAHRQRLLRECRAIEVVFALFNQLRDLLAGGLEAPDACFAVKVPALDKCVACLSRIGYSCVNAVLVL
jgi:hypothetical protein